MEITTERLRLRVLVEEDWKAILGIACHPSVRPFLLPGQDTEAYTRRWVDGCVAQTQANTGLLDAFMIHRHGDDNPIGVCALTVTDQLRGTASLGWELAPAFWHRGYTTEAATAVIQIGFEHREFRQIRSDCYQDNDASRRVMEKLGMRQKDDWRTRLALFLMYPGNRKKVRYELSRHAWQNSSRPSAPTAD